MATSTGRCLEVTVCAQMCPSLASVPGNFSQSRCCSVPCTLKCELQTCPCPEVIATRFQMKNTHAFIFHFIPDNHAIETTRIRFMSSTASSLPRRSFTKAIMCCTNLRVKLSIPVIQPLERGKVHHFTSIRNRKRNI